MGAALRHGGRARSRRASCRPTPASRCCSCAARACASTTTTAASTSTSSAASAPSTSVTRIRRSRRRSREQAAKLVHVSNLFYVEHRAELADDVVRTARRRMEDVLRQLRCRGGRGRDQARAPLGWRAQAGRVQGRHARARRSTAARLPRSPRRVRPRSRRRSSRCPRASSTCPPTTSRRSRPRSTRRVAAVMIEVVQGEGGVWPLSAEYLDGCAAHLRRAQRAAHRRRGPDRLLPHGPCLRAPGVRRRSRTWSPSPRRSPTACRSAASSRAGTRPRRSSRATTARRSAAVP